MTGYLANKFLNLSDFVPRQFGASISFAKIMAALLAHIEIILRNSSQQQMRWPNAWWVITFVQNIKARWDRPIVHLPREPMGQDYHTPCPAPLFSDFPISLWGPIARPKPARFTLLYLIPKSGFNWFPLMFVHSPWHRGKSCH